MFSNLDESLDLSKKLNTFNNTELADMINQNKNNEFQMECGNHENITFRRDSNRALNVNNNSKNNSKNNNSVNSGHNSKGLRGSVLDNIIPQEEEEFLFHDVANQDTEDRNKELFNQIGELKNSVISNINEEDNYTYDRQNKKCKDIESEN